MMGEGNFTFQIRKHSPINDSQDLEGEKEEKEKRRFLVSPLPLFSSSALNEGDKKQWTVLVHQK